MSIALGTKIGPYEVLAPLGAGGMGEVYRAHDSKLRRDIALKLLPQAFAHDLDRLARFEREARLLASLNHPNIAQIFGLEETAELRALVMELVEGVTLDEVIRRSRCQTGAGLPTEEAIAIGLQIADALEAAHEAGIVHRDLKPSNVKVRPDGTVKVLDFGLAKANSEVRTGTPSSSGDVLPFNAPLAEAPTTTQAGVVLGTAAYMSPEQARGRIVDKRTDIWAFGVLLFEMLSGRPLFAGETVSDTIAAVLTREPSYTELPACVPPHIRMLLARCLERDPKRRLRDIGEARHQLEHPSSPLPTIDSTSGVQPQSITQGQRQRTLWIAVVIGLALTAGAVFVWQNRDSVMRLPSGNRSLPGSSQSIAVLPFVNESGSSDDEYFADGMTDELASALMKVNGLRVAAHSSTFTFKQKAVDVREVGSKLNVAVVLEGTVRRSGPKLRVTAQLVNASDGLALWSERYERDASDVFKVQDDITGAIVSALQLRLRTDPASNRKRQVENVEVHDLYLRGRFLMLKQTEEGLRKSLNYFSQALGLDPSYAPAYDAISYAWIYLADAFVPPRDAYPKAESAAQKALELDPTDGDALAMLATVQFFYEWNVPAAEQEFRRALQLNPNSLQAHYLHALTLCNLKQFDEGLREADLAITLDPLSALPSWVRENCLYMSRRFDQVIIQHQRTSELDPDFYYLDSPVAIAYREKGMFAESVAEYQHLQNVTGQPMPGLAVTYARMGMADQARAVLREVLDRASHQYVSAEQVAMIYANLGEKNQAFSWLQKAYEARSAWLISEILVASSFDPIRDDPRYAALVKKMKLEQ